MSPNPTHKILLFDPSTHAHHLCSVSAIHTDCILIDHTEATFVLPLSQSKILSYWETNAAQVTSGQRDIFLYVVPKAQALTTTTATEEAREEEEEEEDEVVGVVSLFSPGAETGPFRAQVEKLLVRPQWRYRGIARALMEALENRAKETGRTLLVRMWPALVATISGVLVSAVDFCRADHWSVLDGDEL